MTEEIFNLDEALSRVEGDHQLLAELAGVFLQEYPKMVSTLHAALAQQDPQSLYHAAHTLKGSVGNFGAKAAFAAAFTLEQLGR